MIKKMKMFRCWYFSNTYLMKYSFIYLLKYDPTETMHLWKHEVSEIGSAEADYLCTILKTIRKSAFQELKTKESKTIFSFQLYIKPIGAPLLDFLLTQILEELKLKTVKKVLLFDNGSKYATGIEYHVELT